MSDVGTWTDFLVRISSTAIVVVLITGIAARLGPRIGGVLIGLPIVLAPGFFFMLRDQPLDFVGSSASGALYSLAATQIFLIAFIVASTRLGAVPALSCAILIWCALAVPFAFLPHYPLAGSGLFALVTILAREVGRRFVDPGRLPPSPTRWSLLILRGLAAGALVGCVTLAASRLGASLSGTILAFPIGFCVILLSLRLDQGVRMASQTAHAGLLGVLGLACFCLVLAAATRFIGPWPAFVAALLSSVAVTAVLTVRAQSQRSGNRLL
ncbi:hypothetical protein [Rhizobium halophilum]|uniref:hypothetical protein n=1 Tax=Rhizobium halophilum TaxID=2846852 RepID=UPI001EFC5A71|nr:hypothetical protein [Rhizobium halophilum]MCF6370821.1 hypothetical protein [Rhizobium halophilum]